ncbi:MAG: nucleotidyl transferase AbiEii/AbiGii toxin family protein [Bacteroidales bacterium]|jgi:hypothetical protein|nr:nucleotidyl transferase AbiEii/AbiGii toxin family protein [Bacteroidales bacterium]
MKLHYETVSPALLKILHQLMEFEVLRNFRLVGGTSLALQRGHRRSIDIDLFTDMEYGKMPLADIRQQLETVFPIHRDLGSMTTTAFGYSLRLGYEPDSVVKVDLFYTEKFIFDAIVADDLRLADEREIAAMKLLAIGNGSYRMKDYWDVRELLDSYTLADMINWCLLRHPYVIEEQDILTALQNVHLVQESNEGIDSLRRLDYWELKREEIKDFVYQYLNRR